VALSELGLARMQNADLVLTDLTTGKTMTVTQHFFTRSNSIEEIRLDAGITLTLDQINTMAVRTGSTGGDTLNGTSAAEGISGLAGNDLLDAGAGDDPLAAGAGDDTMAGRTVSDTYMAGLGQGDDTIIDSYFTDAATGDGGDDLYLWQTGDSNDQIWNSSFAAGDLDTIWLQDLLQSDVTYARDPFDIYSLLVRVTATGQVIQIVATFTDNPASKVLLDIASLTDLPVLGTAGANTIDGNPLGTVFDAGAGNDLIRGGEGDDTCIWRAGSGADRIDEGGNRDGADALWLQGLTMADARFQRQGFDNIVITFKGQPGSVKILHALAGEAAGIESLIFGVGTLSFADMRDRLAMATLTGGGASNNTLTGTIGNETFLSDGGDDLTQGNGGRDHLVVGSGTGNDTITSFVGGAFGTVIEVQGGLVTDFSALLGMTTQVGADVVLALAAGVSLTLTDTYLSDLDAANFGFAQAPIAGPDCRPWRSDRRAAGRQHHGRRGRQHADLSGCRRRHGQPGDRHRQCERHAVHPDRC